MVDDQAPQSPEVLKAIQTAERKVERMLRSAEREAAALLEKTRSQVEVLMADTRRTIEARKHEALDQGRKEAERAAERAIFEARKLADELKARSMSKVDEAAELVLRRVLPIANSEQRTDSSEQRNAPKSSE